MFVFCLTSMLHYFQNCRVFMTIMRDPVLTLYCNYQEEVLDVRIHLLTTKYYLGDNTYQERGYE